MLPRGAARAGAEPLRRVVAVPRRPLAVALAPSAAVAAVAAATVAGDVRDDVGPHGVDPESGVVARELGRVAALPAAAAATATE